jgi:hypothetical protein
MKEDEQNELKKQINQLQNEMNNFESRTPNRTDDLQPFALFGENTGVPRLFLNSVDKGN